jgi:hypothetical protein
MELRQLTTECERQMFGKYLAEARATRGIVGLKETARSQLCKTHLTFGNLYAIFENPEEPPERMIGGFTMHDLATLPQSYPRPDLSHLPPRLVLEGSELWSLSTGIGRIAAGAAAAVTGVLQAKAIIVYPVVSPVDRTRPYVQYSFADACERVKWPWGETIDGGEVWVQPMILEGEKLEEYVRSGFDFIFQTAGSRRPLRFDLPEVRRKISEPTAPEKEEPNGSFISSERVGDERNGAASL